MKADVKKQKKKETDTGIRMFSKGARKRGRWGKGSSRRMRSRKEEGERIGALELKP